jgi:Bacterial Ig-like domain (group 1)/Leishmanolysin
MYTPRLLRILPLLGVIAAAACADGPTSAPPPEPPVERPQVLGVYEITLTGVDGSDVQASVAPVPGGPSFTLTPHTTGIAFEQLSSSSFTEGARGQGGHRYVSITYRVRNSTADSISNLTLIPTSTGSTISGTPFSSLVLFNGTAASSTIAGTMVPTGAATLGGGSGMRATEVDVLQVFEESEVAAITPPAGVTGFFPYGFVVRSATSATNRTLPPAASVNDFGGLVTFSFRYPLTASANQDPFVMSFQVAAVEDTETRMTESMEEAQDTSAVRRIRERAAAIGATTVTVLPGSSAAASDIPDYPGQRQLCTVRTAGTAASPTRYINSTAAYTRINLRRPGESNSACGAYFRTGTPTLPTPGAASTLTLVAMDRYGNVRTDVDSVSLERVSGPTATIGARAAFVAGEASIDVTYGSVGSSILRAVGRRNRTEHLVDVGAPSVIVSTGNRQSAMAGAAVGTRPAVLVRDAAGNPLPGRAVTFSVASGGGSITSAVATTDASGVATVGSWTLGATANLNTLTATVAGSGVTGSPVTFSAAGCQAGAGSGYGITLCFNSSMTASQRAAFENAATRWQGLVTGDLSNIAVSQASGFCGSTSPSLSMTVDDLLIFAAVESIDGVGGVLGSAGPCWIRNTGFLSIVGTMRFDAADVAGLEASGQFGSVILHEMGHVLGIGSLWTYLGLLQSPSSAGSVLDTYFSGAGGITGFNNIGGSTYTGGQKVPVENTGGAGTINGHWRESVLANELMTGWLNSGVSNPLSELTVRSLGDMGYTVNVAGADAFFLTLSLRNDGAEEDGILLMDDIYRGPIHRVDEQGRATLLPVPR